MKKVRAVNSTAKTTDACSAMDKAITQMAPIQNVQIPACPTTPAGREAPGLFSYKSWSCPLGTASVRNMITFSVRPHQ